MYFGFGRLERLFVDNSKQFYAAAMSITGNRAMAEDVVHDALLSVAVGGTEPKDLKAYVFASIRNKAIYQLKQSSRASSAVRTEDFISNDAVSDEDKVFLQEIAQHLQSLDMNQKQVLVLKLFADLTFAEIAEIMGCPANTVASWYRRGLILLKEKFSAD